MGVVMTMGLALMFVQVGMELYCVFEMRPEKFFPEDYSNKLTRFFMSKLFKLGPWVEKNPINSFIFSMALSIGLGAMWPVAGAAAAISALGSTLVCQMVYIPRRKYHRYLANRALGMSVSQAYKNSKPPKRVTSYATEVPSTHT